VHVGYHDVAQLNGLPETAAVVASAHPGARGKAKLAQWKRQLQDMTAALDFDPQTLVAQQDLLDLAGSATTPGGWKASRPPATARWRRAFALGARDLRCWAEGRPRSPSGGALPGAAEEDAHALAKLRRELDWRRARDAAAKTAERRARVAQAAQKGGRQAHRYAGTNLEDIGDLMAEDVSRTSRPASGQQAARRILDDWWHLWTRRRAVDARPSARGVGDEELPPITVEQLKDVRGSCDWAGYTRYLMAGFGREVGFSPTVAGLDLQRFYENVRPSHLLEATKMHHFPLKVVRGLCCICAGWRAAPFEGCIFANFEARAAIVAGCSGELAHAVGPCVSLRNVVDDVLPNASGTRGLVVAQMIACVDSLFKDFHELDLPLAVGKCKYLASDAALDKELQASRALPGTSRVDAMEATVYNRTLCTRRSVVAQAARGRAECWRGHRHAHSRRSGLGDAGVLERMGAASSALWGAAAAGLADGPLRGLRVKAAAAARLPEDYSLGLRFHRRPQGGRLDPPVLHSMDVHFMWALAVWEQHVKGRVLDVTLAAAVKRASRSQHPWRTARTPAGAALLAARMLGWDFTGPYAVRADESVAIDLLRLGPRQVKEEVRRAAARASDKLALEVTGKALAR
ncbi:unnamed protein product, partial [Prorocentrum cordatum]